MDILKWLPGIAVAVMILLTCSPGYAQTDQKTLFNEGVSKYKAGKYQEAVDLFSRLIIIAPDNAKAYKNRGVALMNLIKMDHAISDFTKAMAIDPELKGLYSNLGAVWHYKGEDEKSIQCYNKAIEEDPTGYITYYNRGISRAALNQTEGAVADFEKSIELNPGFSAAIYARQEVLKMLAGINGETYAVQTGAFLVESNALKNKITLVEKGGDARVVVFRDAGGKTWYVVRCGNNLTREEAKNLEDTLKHQHDIKSIVRPEHSL